MPWAFICFSFNWASNCGSHMPSSAKQICVSNSSVKSLIAFRNFILHILKKINLLHCRQCDDLTAEAQGKTLLNFLNQKVIIYRKEPGGCNPPKVNNRLHPFGVINHNYTFVYSNYIPSGLEMPAGFILNVFAR